MIVKDSHTTPSSGTFKPRKLGYMLSQYVLILVFLYLSSSTSKAFNEKFLKSLVLLQMVLYFSDSLASILKDINL